MSDWETVAGPGDGWETVSGPQLSPLQKGAGDVMRGLTAPVTATLDLPNTAANLVKAGAGTVQGLVTGKAPSSMFDPSPGLTQSLVDRGLTAIGLPDYQPTGFFSDLIKRATQYTAAAMTGGATVGGVKNVGTAVAPSLAATGGATTHALLPDSPTAEVFGEIAPSLVTGGVKPQKTAPLRTQAQANVDTIREAGGNPTVNQTQGNWFTNFIEGVGGRAPGGDYVTWNNAKKTNAGMGKRVGDIASGVSDATSPMQGGAAVNRGIDAFVDNFKSRFAVLNGKVSEHFAPTDGIPITNTLRKLDELIAEGGGAEESMAALKGTQREALIKFRDGLKADAENIATPAQPQGEPTYLGQTGFVGEPGAAATAATRKPGLNAGEIEYESFRKLRSTAGENGATAALNAPMSKGDYKAIYGAMSEDLRAAAAAKGPEALKAFDNQNKFYKAGISRIEKVLQPLSDKFAPEKVYTAAISGADKGATTLNALRRSLPTSDWKDFVSTFIDHMGKAKPGQQNAAGTEFSAKSFLTDWGNLSPQAKNALFGDASTPKLRADMDTVAKAAELVTRAGGQYANPSGSAVLGMNAATAGVAADAARRLDFGTVGTVATTVLGNYTIQKRLMTNPKFVDWLAKGASVPAEKLPAFAASLMAIGNNANDEDIKAFAAQLK